MTVSESGVIQSSARTYVETVRLDARDAAMSAVCLLIGGG